MKNVSLIINHKSLIVKAISILLLFTIQVTGFPAVSFAQDATPSAQTEVSPIAEPTVFDTLTPIESGQSITPAPAEEQPLNDVSNNIEIGQSQGFENNSLASPIFNPNDIYNNSASLRQPFSVRINKKGFRADEKVTITVGNSSTKNFKVKLFDYNGQEIEFLLEEVSDVDPAVLRVYPKNKFKPGRYRLVVTDLLGDSFTQDFNWGVLSINTNKSIYLPNETAKIFYGVLNETGSMVCDAQVELKITNQELGVDDTLSTGNGKIIVNPECSQKNFTLIPDFESEYKVGGKGVYNLLFSATTANGDYSINDSFEVRDTVAFDVERAGPTRIYPPTKYPVTFTITANEDFEGKITDLVPDNMEIFQQEGVVNFNTITTLLAAPSTEIKDAQIENIRPPFEGKYNITQDFGGVERDPILKKKYAQYGVIGHDGVDFDLALGTPVVSTDDGVVVKAQSDGDYGTTIIIQHSWGKSYYGHLSEIKVVVGDNIKKGQEIALSGNSGLSTGAHLHFGVKPNRNEFNNGFYGKINPLVYLSDYSDSINLSQVNTNPSEVLGAKTEVEESDYSVSLKAITWDIKLKKGDVVKLGYAFKAPDISPEFYLFGPLEFKDLADKLVFKEARQWQIAADAINPDGNLYYGDLDTSPTTDKLRMQTYTDSSNTFSAEVNLALPSASSGDTNWVVAKQSPTRNEQIVAFMQDGATADLFVDTCVGGCDAVGDYAAAWSNAGVGPVLTCDTTAGACARPFDVGYEQLSGDGMVVYGDNASATSGSTSKVYYCLYSGSAWSPVSNCTPTDATNQLPAITNFNGIPRWIRVIPMGEQLTRNRSDRILVLAMTDGGDIGAWIWNGSNFTTLASTLIVDALSTTATPDQWETMPFDGAWETISGDAVVLYGDSATEDTTPAARKVYSNSGNTWDGSGTAIPAVSTQCNAVATTTYIARWIEMAASPNSDVMIAALGVSDAAATTTTPAFFPYHWDGSVWVQGGGTGNSTACDDAVKAMTFKQMDVGFEKYNAGTDFGIATVPDGGTALTVRETRFTGPSTWSALATVFSTTDDSIATDLFPAPNADKIHLVVRDGDADALFHRRWTGSAWDGGNPSATGSIPPNATNTGGETPGYTYVNKMYSGWTNNWRWYAGSDTASVPTTALASENTRPSVGNTSGTDFRLRINVANKGAMGETVARKKLQYVSAATCASPDSCANASWTDVDDPAGAGIWRYIDLSCSPTDCADNTVLTASVLTGTDSTCSAGNGCGTWVLDKNAAAGVNMNHNSNATQSLVQELEYDIENNGAAGNTIYYFRLYDIEDNTWIYRQQDLSTVCAGSSACTYPSIDTTHVDQLHYRWRSDDGNETTGTSLVAEDTVVTDVSQNTNIRLRLTMNSTTGTGSTDYRLEWAVRVGASCDTDESYSQVPDVPTSEAFDMTTTSNYTDQVASTNVVAGPGIMTDPGGSTFTSGKLVESTSNTATAITLAANRFTELEYNFQPNSNATSLGAYCFRLTNAGTPFSTYTRYPQLTMVSMGPTNDQLMRHGKWFSNGVEQPFTF